MTTSRQTKPSTLKLSEIARHVCVPEGIETTGWPAIRDRCARAFGIEFDEWQEGIGRLTFAKRKDGLYAASVGGVLLSIPRQTGKTYFVGWSVFALASIFPGLTVVWTAHRTRTSDETFQKMRSMALSPKVRPRIQGQPRQANGQQQIVFNNGSRILFGAREQGFGRGFDKVDILVFDEAQILTEAAMSDMVPATNAAPNGLVILLGTPPRPKDPGEVFKNRRKEALAGDPDTAFVEFSADEGAKIIDWKQLAKANPSFPHRTSKTAILRMQKLLADDENFKREAYGVWDSEQTQSAAISESKWFESAGEMPASGKKCFGVKFTADGSTVFLGAAIKPPNGPVFVEAIAQRSVADGLGWLVDFLTDEQRAKQTAQIVIDGKSVAPALVQQLKEKGLRRKDQVKLMTWPEVSDAHAMILEAIRSGELAHSAQKALTDQATMAVKDVANKTGAFTFISPDGTLPGLLTAVTLAHWSTKTTKRRTGNGTGRSTIL